MNGACAALQLLLDERQGRCRISGHLALQAVAAIARQFAPADDAVYRHVHTLRGQQLSGDQAKHSLKKRDQPA